MGRETIKRKTSRNIRVLTPIDAETNTVLNDAAGASSSFKVYDPSKDESFSLFVASSTAILDVTDAGVFVVNDIVEAMLDTGLEEARTVIDVDIANQQITVTSGFSADASSGNRIRVVLDSASSITQTEFGTANIDEEGWGYTGIFPDTHAAHNDPRTRTEEGFHVNAESTFLGGAGQNVVDIQCLTIKEDCADEQ